MIVRVEEKKPYTAQPSMGCTRPLSNRRHAIENYKVRIGDIFTVTEEMSLPTPVSA